MNKKIVGVIVVIIIAGASFYGGMQYGKNSVTSAFSARFGQGGAGGGQRGARGGANGGGFVTGTVLSQDTNGITVQLRSGGSQIILISSSTPIMKSVAGGESDLQKGQNVMVMGTTNPDGSLTAESVQIRQASN
ncbi:MAG: DUF5666 domain-containing protein [Candidatus Pacebacteria bacterium]|nr:DUF5666 domain-containing protein [Candidatus Paceibacterota bacterium]